MNQHSSTTPPSFKGPRRVSGFTATCVLISNVVGGGIFTTTGFMARDLGDPSLILLLWAIGAVLALAGAMCYSELGAALPLAGGEYIYLSRAYHPLLGFLSGWASFTVGFGAAVAAGAVSFSSYALQVFPVGHDANLAGKALALGLVWLLTAVHVAGVGIGGLVQQILTVLKVGAMLGLMFGAWAFGQGDWGNLTVTAPEVTPGFGTVIVSLIFVTYSYSGWNAAGYIAGEIDDPGRNIPLTMIGGTVLVGLLYFALNLVYFYALPVTTLGQAPLLPVAEKTSVALFGPNVRGLVAGLLCLSIAGAVSAMIWAGPRVYYAMAKDGLFPAYFAKIASEGGVPGRSILLQSVWVTILILSGTFEQLVIYSGVVIAIFTGLAIGAVMVLRVKRPELPRPFRVPLYPVLPWVYILTSVMIVGYGLFERPLESVLAVFTVLTGVPLYFYWRRRQSKVSSCHGFRGKRWHCFLLVSLIPQVLLPLPNSCALGTAPQEPDRQSERDWMVDRQIAGRGIKDSRVLEAMRTVPRHRFVPEPLAAMAYHDRPLPIGHRQTISQPYIVAFMTEAVGLTGQEKVLEIGTGSGYQAAILAQIVPQVFTIEIVEPLATQAKETLRSLGYTNVTVRVGDGYRGWPEEAPFDVIIVTAAPDHVPQPLLEQLKIGGRLILPTGTWRQELILIRRTETGFERTSLLPVAFVPMTGEAEERAGKN